MNFFRNLQLLFSTFRWTDLVDILVISVIIYYIMLLVRETRAEQLIKGFAVVLALAWISDWLNLYTVNWLISNLLTVGLILVIVIFQPELRRAFERIGRTQGWFLHFNSSNTKKSEYQLDEVVRAVGSLSRQKIGALIVFEGQTGLNEVIESGTPVDGIVSSELLINLFIPNTPLHDGAVVIRDGRLVAAGVFLPLTDNKFLDSELGTRHRAALGISEQSDCLSVVVSEETGIISVCQNGKIARRIDEGTLAEILNKFYVSKYGTVGLIPNLLNADGSQEEADKTSGKEAGLG